MASLPAPGTEPPAAEPLDLINAPDASISALPKPGFTVYGEPLTGSLLLDLPREIRAKIYTQVFKHVIVNLEKDAYYLQWKVKPRMALCVGNIHIAGYRVPARLASRNMKAECRIAGWEADRHPSLKMLGPDGEKSAYTWTNQNNLLAVLLVCHKMRKEARPIAYSTLVFCVEPDYIWDHSTRLTLPNFRRSLKQQDRIAVQRLSVQWSVYGRDTEDEPGTLGGSGDRITQFPNLKLFPGLNELWIEVIFCMRMPKMDLEEVWVKRLLTKICGLNLKTGRLWLHNLVEPDLTQIYAFGDKLSEMMMASSTYVESEDTT